MSERHNARQNLLRERWLLERLRDVADFLRDSNTPCALVGGLAVAYHANPPVTADVDLLVNATWKTLLGVCKAHYRPLGWRVTVFGFPRKLSRPGQPMKGVRLVTPDQQVTFDLLSTGHDEYLQAMIDRSALVMLVSGSPNSPTTGEATACVRIAPREDLIITKIMSGREKDTEDVEALMNATTVNKGYIVMTMAKLGLKGGSHG